MTNGTSVFWVFVVVLLLVFSVFPLLIGVGLLQLLLRNATFSLIGCGSWLWLPLIGASDHQHFLPVCWL